MTEKPTAEVQNLDCMDKDELLKIILFGHPELLLYAALRHVAIRFRERGDIEEALEAELRMERAYKKLPPELRW